MKDLVAELSASAQSGDCVVITVPLKLQNDVPWRDGSYPMIDSGEKTEPELRQEQLPTSKVAKAFTHIQAPRLFISASSEGTPGRHALSVYRNHPEAVEFVRRFYNQLGFDTVDNSPLSEA
ncbi:hypothetical protein ABMA57_00070 [Saccharospirillum sp. HFRX-1]|uniref:hypothetical protein n=1 Tax=unclassified Saccharospirillum TaxID=2633430 RepID=UPI00371452E3